MTRLPPAVVCGLVAAAAAVGGAHLERWRQRRARAAALQIIERFAQEALDRAARQDAEGPWGGQWVASNAQAWAQYQEGPEKAGEN